MASIIHRGPYQFQVLIRRKGYPPQTKTFETQREAKDWVHDIEAKMRRGEFADLSEAEATTLGELLERYRLEVTPEKRGHAKENYRVLHLSRHPIALRSLASLRNVDFSDYRNERLKQVGPKTVQLELSLISAVLNTVRRDWSIPIANSVTDIRKPKLPLGLDRRFVGDEEKRLFAAARECRSFGLNVCNVLFNCRCNTNAILHLLFCFAAYHLTRNYNFVSSYNIEAVKFILLFLISIIIKT